MTEDGDFSLGQLGREPLQTDVGKTDLATAPPSFTVRLSAMGGGAKQMGEVWTEI
jgi:hypothetical protein